MTYYTNDARLADMVQGLFCDILKESCARPKNFEESFHLLSALKRRGLEKRLEAEALSKERDAARGEIERLHAELEQANMRLASWPHTQMAAQLGPSDEEIAAALERCYLNPAVQAEVWLALRWLARRAGVEL